MIQFLNVLQYLVLALWVGGMFGFGALYAPVLFRKLPSRSQAGEIAGETLARIESLGLITGGIMLVVTALQAINSGWQSIDLGRALITVAMLALLLVNSITIRQRVSSIREQMGRPIDELEQDDPLRREHSKYHRLSRAIFSLNMLLGVLLIALSALRPA
jgi:hypothetical protein